MSVLLKAVIFWTIFTSTVKHIHALDVDPNGIYSDIIVEISDKVPRQKCQRALDNFDITLINRFSKSVRFCLRKKVNEEKTIS